MSKFYGYIYLIQNTQNRKVYIGQKSGLPEKSKNYYGSGVAINKSIKKYGKKFFKKRILGILEANLKENLRVLLNEAETECIYFYRSFGSDGINYDKIYGYNLTITGSSNLGVKIGRPSDKTIEKTREKNTGQKRTIEQVSNIRESHLGLVSPRKGMKMTPEQTKNMHGGEWTPERRKAQSERRLGKKDSDEVNKSRSIKLKGIPKSPETIAKRRESRKRNNKPSPLKGIKKLPESIEKRKQTALKNDSYNKGLKTKRLKGNDNSKNFKIIFVDNTFVIINNLTKWCKENNIIMSSLYRASKNNKIHKNIKKFEIYTDNVDGITK